MSAIPQPSQNQSSQAAYPFLRVAQLFISGVPEWRGGGAQSQMIQIIGDGTTSNLRIRFEIRKHQQSTSAPTFIYVYNLSQALRQTLAKIAGKTLGGSEIELKVGWQNFPAATIFSGTLLACFSERQEADIVTSLVSLAGYGGMMSTVLSQTWAGGSSLLSIIKNIAGQIPGVTVGQINVTDRKMGTQGYSMAGGAQQHLNDLARTYGFRYGIDKGVFTACDDTKVLSETTVPLLSFKNGFLKRIEPMLFAPFQQVQGWTIQSLINPHVNVGASVQVESQINPQYNGKYPVNTLSITGDTHGNEWDMRIESLLIGPDLPTPFAG